MKSTFRFPTWDEMQIMLRVNELLHVLPAESARIISTQISDRLMRSVKPGNDRKIVFAEEMRSLEGNNRDVLEFVNDFAGRAFELKFRSDSIGIGERIRPDEDGNRAIYRAIIASLIEQIEARQPAIKGRAGTSAGAKAGQPRAKPGSITSVP